MHVLQDFVWYTETSGETSGEALRQRGYSALPKKGCKGTKSGQKEEEMGQKGCRRKTQKKKS